MLAVSIVTPSYNQGEFIEQCLLSVKGQGYPAVEHIVIDGGSTDNTLEILNRYSSQPGWEHLKWISEPDRGQSDALNKGFRLATGDIIGWLNSDDTYADGCFQVIAQAITSYPDVDVFYGDYNWVDERGGLLKIRREIEFSRFIVRFNRMCFIQSSGALFLKRNIFQRGHFLDENYCYAMDYEFYLRLLNNGYRFRHVGTVLGSFRWHANSKTSNYASQEAREISVARKLHAPCLKRLNRHAAKCVTATFGVLATVLRWGEKAVRGYYFDQGCS